MDEQDGRALPSGEVVHAHPSPCPGGAAPAQLLQRQRRRRRRRRRRGRWSRAAGAGTGASGARGTRHDAGRGSGAETAMGTGPRGEAVASARCWSSGDGGGDAVVVGGKCCHIHPPLGSVVIAGRRVFYAPSLRWRVGTVLRFVLFLRFLLFFLYLFPSFESTSQKNAFRFVNY